MPLEALAEAALAVGADRAALAEQHRREATRLTISAQAGTIAASLWAVYSGSWATLWGGAAIAVVLLAMAVVARYRAWQVEHGRMFETQAPFGEFLAFEAAGLSAAGPSRPEPKDLHSIERHAHAERVAGDHGNVVDEKQHAADEVERGRAAAAAMAAGAVIELEARRRTRRQRRLP